MDKKIAIIGASGFVGSAITKEALTRGYRVTAITRHPEDIPDSNNLTAVQADIFDTEGLTGILKGFDTVISSYNPGWNEPEIYRLTIKGYRSIIKAAKKAGAERLLIVGGAGSLYVEEGKMLLDTGAIPDHIMPGAKALAEVYIKILPEERNIDWVFFSPAQNLIRGERTGNYRTGRDNLILDVKGESVISVEDYAKEMIDEAEMRTRHRERFTIGYRHEDEKVHIPQSVYNT